MNASVLVRRKYVTGRKQSVSPLLLHRFHLFVDIPALLHFRTLPLVQNRAFYLVDWFLYYLASLELTNFTTPFAFDNISARVYVCLVGLR